MRERNLNTLRDHGVSIDPLIASPLTDTRKGVGLFSFIGHQPPALSSLLADVRESFADQICYTPSPPLNDNAGRMHFTFFQFIKVDSIPDTFSESDMNRYIEISRAVISTMKPLTVVYKGVMAIPTGLLVYGYPSYDINPYREQLRERVIREGITFVEPYKSNIVHSTVMRISSPLPGEKLLSFANRYTDKELFSLKISAVHLGYGSWRMREDEIRMVGTLSLLRHGVPRNDNR